MARTFFQFSALAFGLALTCMPAARAAEVGIGPSFKGPVGLQLYSLRAEFIRNVPAALDKVERYGIRPVELAGTYNLSAKKFRELLDAHHFDPISGHWPFERLRDDLPKVIEEAKTLGVRYVGCAWIPHDGDFKESDCRKAIEVFSKAGAELAKSGMKFFYHAHGYEFQPHDKGTLLDLLMEQTKPEHVAFQMDVLWVVFPGQDPVKLLKKYGKRWELMHLKDLKKGVKTGELTGKTDVSNDVTLGTGQMNWPVILKEAARQGVKYYFIEDESPTAAEQIPNSLKFLEQVRF